MSISSEFVPRTLRYLLQISYVGTRYRGLQRLERRVVGCDDKNKLPSVQSILEKALRKLNPAYDPIVVNSSRTDSGVHALMNAATVELTHRERSKIYDPDFVTTAMNDCFLNNQEEIRVVQTRIVPWGFHPRNACIARSYMYRLALLKPDSPLNALQCGIGNHVPLHELYRSFPIRWPNVEKMQKAAELFVGRHDFASFMTHTPNTDIETPIAIRRVMECWLRPAPNNGQLTTLDPLTEHYEMWEFYVKANSFVYNQIRRMVAAVISVGRGHLDLDDIKYMLDNASKSLSTDRRYYFFLAPPHALYLVRVHFNEEDLSMKIDPEAGQWHEAIMT